MGLRMTSDVLMRGPGRSVGNCGARPWRDHPFRREVCDRARQRRKDVCCPRWWLLERLCSARRGPGAVLAGSMCVCGCFHRPIKTLSHSHLPGRRSIVSCCVGARSARSRPRFKVGARPGMMPAWPWPPMQPRLHVDFAGNPRSVRGLAVSESCANHREWRLAAANNWPSWRTNWQT